MPIEVVGADERDNNWENHHPRFRVYLHTSGATQTQGSTDTYDIIGADMAQVIDWAQRQAGELLTYAVALVIDDEAAEVRNPGCGRGLVWLLGMDGNEVPWDDQDTQTVMTQRRMVQRRNAPIALGPDDLMPPRRARPVQRRDPEAVGDGTTCGAGE